MSNSTKEMLPLPDLARTFVGYELVTIVFSIVSALAVIIALVRRTRSCETATYTKNLPMVLTVLFAWLYASVPLSMALMYFGIPKTLTLGYQIDGILPTDCGTSMSIEGPDGLPCSLKRFSSWLGKAARLYGSGLHREDFETHWRDVMLRWSLHLVIIVAFCFFCRFIGWLADEEIAQKEERERMKRCEVQGETMGSKEGWKSAPSFAL